MRGWIVLSVVLVVFDGCGFRSPASIGGPGGPDGGSTPPDVAEDAGDATVDARVDAMVDAGDGPTSPVDCLAQWRNHTVQIASSSVQEIAELSSAGDDRRPWISDDGLRLYFARDLLMGPPSGDLYVASRTSTSQPFTAPGGPIPNLNSLRLEGRPSLTSDELMIALSTNRDGQFDINISTRAAGAGFGTADATHLGPVNALDNLRLDPFLSVDGLRLYLAIDHGQVNNKLQIMVSTRASIGDDFSTPSLVPGVDDSTVNQLSPALSRDERILFYAASTNAMKGDLRYATRASATAAFDSPHEVPGVNTDDNESDPVLSPDGCELYFASTRGDHSHYHLYRAEVMR